MENRKQQNKDALNDKQLQDAVTEAVDAWLKGKDEQAAREAEEQEAGR